MTLCAAVLCKLDEVTKADGIVCVSDRLITCGDVGFETKNRTKAYRFSNKIWAFFAGTSSVHESIVKRTHDQADEKKKAISGGTKIDLPVEDYAKLYEQNLAGYEREEAERRYLARYDLDLALFKAEQRNLGPAFVRRLEKRIESVKAGVDVLIVGFDSGGAQMYCVRGKGTLSYENDAGYCAVGIGEYSFCDHFHSLGYDRFFYATDAILRAYEAKKKAESVEGVGRETTDLFLITDKGGKNAEQGLINVLKVHHDTLQKTVNGLNEEFISRIKTNESYSRLLESSG